MTTQSPVLFLVFNRPEPTKRVFDEIRKARPPRLYIAADGPREGKEGEVQRCQDTRKMVLDAIDWRCEVKTLFRDQNLGCKKAVSGAIDWFFQHEEQGIILEDDCLPNASFFEFCDNALQTYAQDCRVMHVTGSNFVSDQIVLHNSYYFSQFANIWGWATWRRAWLNYDVEMKKYPQFEVEKGYESIFTDPIIAEELTSLTSAVYSEKLNTWDVQWIFTIIVNNGLCIVPVQNLISNIGFGADATHTNNHRPEMENRERKELGLWKMPSFMNIHHQADTIYFDVVHEGSRKRFANTNLGMLEHQWQKVLFKLRAWGILNQRVK